MLARINVWELNTYDKGYVVERVMGEKSRSGKANQHWYGSLHDAVTCMARLVAKKDSRDLYMWLDKYAEVSMDIADQLKGKK